MAKSKFVNHEAIKAILWKNFSDLPQKTEPQWR